MSEYKTLNSMKLGQGVVEVCMARPDVYNAFDETMIAELDEIFEQLSNSAEVRVIVLAGKGKHFSAGADLQWMRRASKATLEWNFKDATVFAEMLHKIESCPKPTVAKVQGAALGGGVGLICACDIAIGADNTSFAVSEAKFGILPAVIGPYLTNAVGKRQAKRLALTTSRIQSQEALSIGLLHQIVSAQDLDEAVNSMVTELLNGGPIAQAEIKSLFSQFEVGSITADIRELTARTISRVRGTEEAKEGFAAFFEKRPAKWIANHD